MATETREVRTKTYVNLKDVGENDKCPPQARLILSTIKAAGGKMSREDLLVALKRSPDQGGLKTNQSAERILGFYKPKLEADGFFKEEVVVTQTTVEVPDKPAKPPKVDKPAADAAGAPTPKAAAAPNKGKGAKGEHKAA